MSAPDPSLPPGSRVDGWIVGEPIGAGAMGTVYGATDATLGRRVALKVLRRAFADDAAAVARFEREARAASRIEHPGIVDVLAVGTLPDGRPYLVMSLLRGRSLRDELAARGPMPLGDAWAIVRQVALALAAAHDAGVVHRDLKPDNVFLERADDLPPRARILDFGLARLLPAADAPVDAKLTHTGVPMGTPQYMAPEQWWGTDVGPAADQYALGAVLFELLTGHPPFTGDRLVELVQRHLHDAPPRLADRGAKVPDGLEALAARALAKAPAERFASLRDLVAAGDAAAGLGSAPPVNVPVPVPDPDRAPQAARPDPLLRTLGVLAVGLAGLVGAGYSGSARWDVPEWFRIAGYASWLSTTLALVASVVVVRRAVRARRRDEPLRPRTIVLALLPALSGALGTYSGWHVVLLRAPSWPETERLTTVDVGLWEAGAARFLGMGLSAVLFAALAASAAATAGGGAPPPLTRREGAGAVGGVLVLAIAATLGGVASSLWLGAIVAAVLATSSVAPPRPAAGAESARLLSAALAGILAAVVGLARVEGRASILWRDAPTRAARVAEIVATAAEREATLVIAAVLLGALAAVELVRRRRLRVAGRADRPTRAVAALAALVVLGLGTDAWLHARVAGTRGALREALSRQFVIFGRLDPPAARGLRPLGGRFSAHRAPALQVTAAMVAIDAEPAAPLRALESQAGALGLVAELGQAMAQGADDRAAGAPDLSLAVDRRVPWRSVARVLAVAYAAGARQVEVLLTIGRAPRIPATAPPEAAHVLPRDFAALPATLVPAAAAPAAPDPDASFEQVTRGWAARARTGAALRIGVGAP